MIIAALLPLSACQNPDATGNSSSRDDPVKFFQYLNKYNVSLILLQQKKKNIPVIQLLLRLPAANLLLRADDHFLFSYDPNLLPAELLQH